MPQLWAVVFNLIIITLQPPDIRIIVAASQRIDLRFLISVHSNNYFRSAQQDNITSRLNDVVQIQANICVNPLASPCFPQQWNPRHWKLREIKDKLDTVLLIQKFARVLSYTMTDRSSALTCGSLLRQHGEPTPQQLPASLLRFCVRECSDSMS